MIVFHGSTLEIQKPDVLYSKRNLDFGRGFYVTSVKEQAERWAARKAMRFGGVATVNAYDVGDMSAYRSKEFKDADSDWLHFVVDCRNGLELYKQYDVVAGKVADDDVFKCVNMFMDGHWDEGRTLKEIRYYKNNDQIAFITQEILDDVVIFRYSYEVVK